MLSFQQLSTPVTEDEALAAVVTRLTELGFSATSWQSGSVKLTMCRAIALLWSKGTEMVQALLYSGYNDFAEGEYLTRYSKSHYDNTRVAAVAFRVKVVHTVAPGEGPYTINVGQLTATNGTYKYRNVEDDESPAYPVTLTSATPVTLVYEAEIPGAAPSTADNTITTLITSIVGVTINNPPPSVVRAGAEEESDASLRLRNSTKWALLSVEVPRDGYKHLVLSVLPNFRVVVDDSNAQGAGTLDIYIASPTGLAGSGDEIAAQALIGQRRSVTATPDVVIASGTAVNVLGTVHIATTFDTPETHDAIEQAVTDYINSLDIGGVKLLSTRVIPKDGIEAAIRSVPGVRNVDLTTPAADLTIAEFNVAIMGTFAPTYVGV